MYDDDEDEGVHMSVDAPSWAVALAIIGALLCGVLIVLALVRLIRGATP